MMMGLRKVRGGLRNWGRIFLAGSALSLAAACSDRSAPETSGGSPAQPQAAECGGLLSRSDIEEAFGGALSVQSTTVAAMGSEVAGCLIMIEEGINNRLSLTVGDAQDYQTRKDSQSRQTGGTRETFDAGAEAQIYNGIYAIALLDDGRSITIGLSQKAVEEEALLTPDQSGAGIRLLTERVVSRLEAR